MLAENVLSHPPRALADVWRQLRLDHGPRRGSVFRRDGSAGLSDPSIAPLPRRTRARNRRGFAPPCPAGRGDPAARPGETPRTR